MLRWSGILAALLSAALIVLLWNQTQGAELAGAAGARERGFTTSEELRSRPSPGREFIYLVTRSSEKSFEQEMERLSLMGLPISVSGEGQDERSMVWTWRLEVPEEFARRVQVGEDLVISVRRLMLPGEDPVEIRLVRYRSRSQSAGEAGNWKFLGAWSIAGGPILLWGIAALIAAAVRAKSSLRD